jgi:hypothetical protein
MQQHRIEHAEDRRVGADAERDGENHDACESWRTAQRPDRVLDVAARIVEPGKRARVAVQILGVRHSAERPAGCEAGGIGRHAPTDQVVLDHREMGGHFTRQIVFAAARP